MRTDAPSSSVDIRYAVGVINHRSYIDLRSCLESVKAQSRPAAHVMVVDADPDPPQLDAVRSVFPEVTWEPRPNRGFGAGANRVVERVLCEDPSVRFLLILNPDVVLDAHYSEVVASAMALRPDVALAGGKLLRPDGRTLDSAGIEMGRNRRPRDRGSGTPDRGQYDHMERVFGISGAAMMIRSEAVADLSVNGELLDEDFFTYHEDTDLAWRAGLLGWSCLYVPRALARHVRGWRRDRRMWVPRRIRQHSFKNHYLQILKNERLRDFFANLPVLAAWEILRLGYCAVRDPGVFPGYWQALRLVPRIWQKRRALRSRTRARALGGGGPRRG